MNVLHYARRSAQGLAMLLAFMLVQTGLQAQCGDFLSEPFPVSAPVDITLNLGGTNAPINNALIQSQGAPNFSKAGACDYELAEDPAFSVNLTIVPQANYFNCSHVSINGSYITRYLRVNGPGGPSNPVNFREIRFYVIDDILPVAVAPVLAPFNADAGQCNWTAFGGLADASATDNCNVSSLTYTVTFPDASTATFSNTLDGVDFPKGVSNIDVYATDQSGNVSVTVSYSLTVNDAQAPIASCPSYPAASPLVLSADAGLCSYTSSAAGNSFFNIAQYFSDNCTDLTFDYQLNLNGTNPPVQTAFIPAPSGNADGIVFPVVALTPGAGLHILRYRATDAVGQTAICTFRIVVNDDEDAKLWGNNANTIAYAQGNATIGTSTGVSTPGDLCDGTLTWQHPYVTDNCGIFSTEFQLTGATAQALTAFTPGNMATLNFNLGVTTVQYVVADIWGNTVTYSFDVTVTDNEAPVFMAGGQVIVAPISATDCSKVITFDRPSIAALVGDCGPVTMQEVVVSGPDLGVMAPPAVPAFNTATGGGTVTVQFPAGITRVAYYWIDNAMNFDSIHYTFIVQDTVKPIAKCQNLTRNLNAMGNYTLTAAEANNGSTDNCPLGTVLSITAPASPVFTCANRGVNNYTLRITDASGNTSSANCTITIVDNTPPTITCPSSVSTGTASNACSATVSLGALTATDNCGPVTINWTASGASNFSGTGAGVSGTFNTGLTTIVYTVSDGAQSSVCSATVVVADDDAPVAVSCPANVTVNANIAPGCSFKLGGTPPAGWTWNGPISFTDNCTMGTITPAGQPSHLQVFPLGPNLVTISAVDAAGNIGLCQFTVTVNDQTNPTPVCQNLTRNLSATFPGTVAVTATEFNNGSSDNCYLDLLYAIKKGTNPATPFTNTLTYGCGELGPQVVTFRVTEDGGPRSATATCTITIQDVTPPTPSCPATVNVNLAANGLEALTVAEVGASATDNCASPVAITGIGTAVAGPFGPSVGVDCGDVNNPFTAYLQFSDGNGNTPTCSFTVNVFDVTPPAFSIANATTGNECGAPLPTPVFVINDVCNGSNLTPTIISNVVTPGSCQGEQTTTITYQVADLSGNTSNAVFVVSTQDNTGPVITLPADVTLNLSNYATCFPALNYTAGVSDLCTDLATLTANTTWLIEYADGLTESGTGLTATATSGFSTGENFITFNVIDDCGNASDKTMKITLVDNEAPSFDTYVQPPFPSSTSYCGSNFQFDITTGCTYNFSWYRPYAGPAINFPLVIIPDVTDCNAFNVSESIVTTPPIGAVQNVSPSIPFNPGDPLNSISTTNINLSVGTSVFTYVAADDQGNTSTCSFTVKVRDLTTPTISCPIGGITINSICPTQVIQDYRNSVIVNDNCASFLSISQQYLPNPLAPSVTLATVLGGAANVVDNATFPMTFTVTDNSGNTATCVATVTLEDNQSPLPTVSPLPPLVWNCGFAIVDAPTATTNDCGPNTGAVVYGTPGGVSAVGIATLPGNPSVITRYRITSPPGNYFITWSYNDGNNNVNTQLQALTINPDVAPPVAKCKTTVTNILLSNIAPATASITPQQIDADNGSFSVNGSHDPDNCGPLPNTKQVALSLNKSNFTCADLGVTSVVLTATDNAGNTATCSAPVKVIDNAIPVINAASVPANITVDTCSIGYTPPAPATVTATDNCSAAVSFSQTSTQGTTGPSKYNYVITRVWTATDPYGNSATASQTITVRDTKKPVFAAIDPANLMFNTAPSSTTCSATATFNVGAFVSDCAPDNELNIVVNPPIFSLSDNSEILPVGSHTVNFTVTDPVGNSATTSITIIVKDATKPIASCINGISLALNPNGKAIVTPQLINNQSSDNCGPVTLQIQELYETNGDTIGSPASELIFDCEEADNDTEYPIILWVKDAAGNFNFCETYVVIQDNVAPTITCPANVTVDCNGTTSSFSTAVTGNASATDNCPVSNLTVSFSDAPVAPGYICGNRVRTFVATDLSNNSATCTQTITVEDTKPPVFNTLPPNDTISCNDPLVVAPILKATDNCTPADSIKVVLTEVKSDSVGICGKYQYTVTRTWVATDKCGNSNVHTQVVKVEDKIGPQFLGMPDTITVLTANFPSSTSCVAPVALNAAQYFNDCALLTESTINSIAFSPTLLTPITPVVLDVSGNYPVGNTKVTFTVTDPCGNVGKDSVVIRVIDNSAPVVICNNSVEVALSNNGTAILTPNDIDLNSNDNCGIATRVLNVTTFDCEDLGINPVTLTVTDIYGNVNSCTVGVEVTAGANTGFTLSTAFVAPTFFGAANGSASTTVTGGSNTFTYAWSNSATTSGISGVTAGAYTVTVTDAFTGCVQVATVTIPEGPEVKFTVGNVSGAQNTIVKVPVRVDHFQQISGFTMSLNVSNLVAGTVVTPAALTNITAAISTGLSVSVNGNVVSILYLNNQGQNISLPNGTTLFELCVQLSGAAIGTTSPVNIENSPVQFTVLRNTANGPVTIPAQQMNGSIQITQGQNEYDIAGNITPWQNPAVGVPGVDLSVSGPNPALAFTTTATGTYQFDNILANTNTTTTGVKEQSGNQNINIIDQGLLLKHIFATANDPSPLTSPYQRVAADVNFDGQINIIDFAFIQRLLLGTVTNLEGANAKDWVFIPADYTFPASATQPFPNPVYAPLPVFPQSIQHLPLIQDELDDDFIGVRMGDLNGDAPLQFKQSTTEERSGATLMMRVDERAVQAGETVTIAFKAKDFVAQKGYQMTLAFNPDALELQAIQPGAVPGLQEDANFGTALLSEGLLSTAWVNLDAVTIADDEVLFALVFKANEAIPALSQYLSVNNEMVEPMSTDASDAINGIALDFTGAVSGTNSLQEEKMVLYQNQPNPFRAETTIGFRLVQSERCNIRIYNAGGRLVKTVIGNFEKGYNAVQIRKSDLGGAGVYYYELTTDSSSDRKKMIVIE